MHWTERLSEYLDGDLPVEEQQACAAHLATCDVCRETLAQLQEVVHFADADEDRAPARDLWPGIAARLSDQETASSTAATTPVVAMRRRQVVFTLPQLALAASLLIAVSAGVAYLAGNRTLPGPSMAGEAPVQAQAEVWLPAAGQVERANFADATFDQAIADLEALLAERRQELDPRTVLVIERNLAAIDTAIREARAALDADPANTFLNSYLTEARRKKLDLLRQVTLISSASGD